MIRTYILQFDPQTKYFRAKQGGACPRELVDEASFVEAVNEIALDLKTLYGAIVTEPLTEYDHMVELHDAEHNAMFRQITEKDGGAAVPIPEPEPLADAIGKQVEPVETQAWISGLEVQDGDKEQEAPEVAPVEAQPQAVPPTEPAYIPPPDGPVPDPVVTEEVAVAGIV